MLRHAEVVTCRASALSLDRRFPFANMAMEARLIEARVNDRRFDLERTARRRILLLAHCSASSALRTAISSLPRSSITLIAIFFFNDTATTEIYTLSLHDALPI